MIASTIQMTGELLVDGVPVACEECGDTQDLTATSTRIPVPAWPAQLTCRAGHLSELMTVTNETITAILGSHTGRTRAADCDTFRTEVDGRLVEGELYPVLTLDDLRQTVRVLYRRGLKPQIRREVRAAKRSVRTAAKGAVREVADAIPSRTVPVQERAPRCPYCKGKGKHRLNSKIHDSPTVPCSLCAGTGDATEI
ncbi:hypothetical protein ACFWOJ_38740 [Streptomyces sp. NPDC058439]|uniref:hypothetical protein n=1 Tax=Streptomyces sp. NPDC058439 TaxID=3346500 RepID=UPI003652F33A